MTFAVLHRLASIFSKAVHGPKYELLDNDVTNDTYKGNSISLHRIRSLRDIPEAGVKAGDIGGYVEKESNLTHFGSSWIAGNAKVYGGSLVTGTSRIEDNAEINNTMIRKLTLTGNSIVDGWGSISGPLDIFGPKHAEKDKYGNVRHDNMRIEADLISSQSGFAIRKLD